MNATLKPSPGSARAVAQGSYRLAISTNLCGGLMVERLEHLKFSSLRARILTQQLHEPLYGSPLPRVATDHGDGSFDFEDTEASRFPRRFYRVRGP